MRNYCNNNDQATFDLIMNRLVVLLPLTAIIMMSIFCSCGNSGRPQVDEQAIKDSIAKAFKDSIANVEAEKAKLDSIENVRNSVPPLADLFAFYKKADGVGENPSWSKVKKEVMAYMEKRGLKFVFDGTYKREEYDGFLSTFSGLAYGKNIKYVKENDDIVPTDYPHFGVSYTTWLDDPEMLDCIKFIFKDKAECDSYLEQAKACGFKKDEYDGYVYHYKNSNAYLYYSINEKNGVYTAVIMPEH